MKLQPQNGLVIKSFNSDMRDKELMRIMPLLVFLSDMEDVRIVRDWTKHFNEEPYIDYIDRFSQEKKLNRNNFLKYVVDKIHTEHLDLVFHGANGDKNVVISPYKKSIGKQPCCDTYEEVATSDVDYEEIHQ